MMTLLRTLRMPSLALWLALAGTFPMLLHAQEVSINVGGANTEQAKQDKALADKLPPDQAAAYLKTRSAWSTVGDTVQWLALVGLPIGIVALVLTFRHRRQKLAHETMRLMIEKGLPVPMELINPPAPAKPPKSDLRRGLIWLAIGIALTILMLELWEDKGIWALGLVPSFIGVAYLICSCVSLAREWRENGRDGQGLWRGVFWTLFGISLMLAFRSFRDGDLDHFAALWGVGLLPTGIGVAFLLYALLSWWLSRKKSAQD